MVAILMIQRLYDPAVATINADFWDTGLPGDRRLTCLRAIDERPVHRGTRGA
jgi:hypothetical protein